MHGDRYLSDRESCGNDRCYHSADTQGQEMQEEQLSQDVQNSAAASRLLYYRVNPDTRPSGYVGLRNQGSTCYLNSLLQCLFFTPELRDAILRPDPVDGSSIVCPLKTLFEQMKWGSSAPSTEGITRCLGVSNVHQQQDVAEYFRILMNKIIEDKRDIQQLYQVEMVHSMTYHGCRNETTIRETPVLSLTLSLKCTSKTDIFSVDKALDDVQKVNYFTGDEQLYCEKCQRKQDATSHYDFETLPPILVLNLKRYWFGEAGFRKLHCNVSVPFSLTVESKTYIIHYELFAMCHHHGGIYGGHYVAEIKSYEDNCWYEFNDTRVYKVSGDQNTMDKKNSSTAYLLMYHMAKSVRKPMMYRGLRNQRCTCYLNCLLHCLFFTPELRDAILRRNADGESLVVGLLQKLFEEMMTPDSSPSTEEITRALEMINARQPLDVKECFQRLMNGITEAKGEIRQLYQVERSYLITCHKCSYKKMLEDTTTLGISAQLEKQNSNCTVIFVDHTLAEMQKEQCYCQHCENQIPTLRHWFKTLPQILVIHVERDQVGIKTGVSVPLSLTLGTDELDNDYELFGTCHHIGKVHGDHFASEVKPLDESHWYRFSDTEVPEVPESEISWQAQSSDTVSLLMYRKVKSTAKPGLDRSNNTICSFESATESWRNLDVAQQDSPGANQQESSMSLASDNTACCTDDTEEAAAHQKKQDRKKRGKRPNQCTRV